jgi:S1-C subfamily serine protease
MKDALERSGVTLRRVVIDELRGNTYHAHLVLQSGGRDIEIDCRPSDGIALAVRFERPIFVHTPLLASQSGLARAAGAEVGQMAGLTVQNLTPDLAGHFGFAEGQSGVVVADVDQGGSSALRRGDVIVEVDGAPVVDVSELRRALNLRGTKSHLTVRRDGAFLRLSMAAPGASR